MITQVSFGGYFGPPARAINSSNFSPLWLSVRDPGELTSPSTETIVECCSFNATTTCGSIARFLSRSWIIASTSGIVLPAAGTRPAKGIEILPFSSTDCVGISTKLPGRAPAVVEGVKRPPGAASKIVTEIISPAPSRMIGFGPFSTKVSDGTAVRATPSSTRLLALTGTNSYANGASGSGEETLPKSLISLSSGPDRGNRLHPVRRIAQATMNQERHKSFFTDQIP